MLKRQENCLFSLFCTVPRCKSGQILLVKGLQESGSMTQGRTSLHHEPFTCTHRTCANRQFVWTHDNHACKRRVLSKECPMSTHTNRDGGCTNLSRQASAEEGCARPLIWYGAVNPQTSHLNVWVMPMCTCAVHWVEKGCNVDTGRSPSSMFKQLSSLLF